jgi:hypothetical protein
MADIVTTTLPTLLCEKSNEILINPVRLVGDGHVYEKKVIEEYLLTHDTSPVTGEILKTKELVEETELRYASEQLLRLADMPLTDGLADTLRDEINKSLQQVIHENNAYIKEHATLKLLTTTSDSETPVQSDSNDGDNLQMLNGLKVEEKDLIEKISKIKTSRIKLLEKRKKLAKLENKLLEYEFSYNRAINQVDTKIHSEEQDGNLLMQQLLEKKNRLKILSSINVCNVAFFLWTDGAFGTINTFRLGRTPSILVDWNEINAAWGQAALLLATIAHKLGFTFTRYRIIPMGSNSKIAKAGQERTSYDLSHHGGRWLSGGRFNTAMTAFLECVSELCNYATGIDRSFLLPHTIKGGKIDGFTIKLHANSSKEWTRALKYMLSNLKWLLAWSVRGF